MSFEEPILLEAIRECLGMERWFALNPLTPFDSFIFPRYWYNWFKLYKVKPETLQLSTIHVLVGIILFSFFLEQMIVSIHILPEFEMMLLFSLSLQWLARNVRLPTSSLPQKWVQMAATLGNIHKAWVVIMPIPITRRREYFDLRSPLLMLLFLLLNAGTFF